MRFLTCFFVATLLVVAVPAAGPKPLGRGETVVYISIAAEKRIAAYRMDRMTGRLTHLGDAKFDGEPGALAAAPERRLLLAALRAEGKQYHTYTFDPA